MSDWCPKCNKYHDSVTAGVSCPMAGLMISPVFSIAIPDPLLGLLRELRDALEQAGRSHDNADIPWPWDKSLFVRADAALAEAPKAGEESRE